MKSNSYLIFDKATGHIERQVTCPESLIEYQLAPTEAYIEGGGDDSVLYVDTITLRTRSKGDYPLAKLPLPCTVRIEGAEYKCTTQPVFEFDVPGEYRIEVDAGPRFLKKEFTYAYPPRNR